MATQTQIRALDLSKEFPRSPNELLGPYVILARNIDKTRAAIAGTAGEYHWDCPLAQMFFQFKGIDDQAFYEQVKAGKTDEEILAWVEEKGLPRSEEEILAWAYDCRFYAPTEPAKKAYIEKTVRSIKGHHPYLRSFFEMLDAEEGRI